jgi:hypothetical protein
VTPPVNFSCPNCGDRSHPTKPGVANEVILFKN